MNEIELTPVGARAAGYNIEPHGNGTESAIDREAANHFRVTEQAVLDASEIWKGEGYMRPAAATQIGSGVAPIARPGDYIVEAYK